MSFHTTAAVVLTGAVAAAVYATLVYARRRRRDGEAFAPVKFTATVIVGAIWGGVVATTGQPVTPDTVGQALTTYVGVVVLTEQALKWLVEELGPLRS